VTFVRPPGTTHFEPAHSLAGLHLILITDLGTLRGVLTGRAVDMLFHGRTFVAWSTQPANTEAPPVQVVPGLPIKERPVAGGPERPPVQPVGTSPAGDVPTEAEVPWTDLLALPLPSQPVQGAVLSRGHTRLVLQGDVSLLRLIGAGLHQGAVMKMTTPAFKRLVTKHQALHLQNQHAARSRRRTTR